MAHLFVSSPTVPYQRVHAAFSERKQSPPVRFSTCEFPSWAVLAATQPRNEVCHLIGRSVWCRSDSVALLRHLLSRHTPDCSFGVSVGGMSPNWTFLWSYLEVSIWRATARFNATVAGSWSLSIPNLQRALGQRVPFTLVLADTRERVSSLVVVYSKDG